MASIGLAKTLALGPPAKYSSHPDASTTFIESESTPPARLTYGTRHGDRPQPRMVSRAHVVS